MKYDPCLGLLVHLRNPGNTNLDPFGGIPGDDVCLEGVQNYQWILIILVKMRTFLLTMTSLKHDISTAVSLKALL